MSDKVVVYQNGDTLSILFPVESSVEDVALRHPPAGSPYLVVNKSDLPDFTFHGAWEADFSNHHGIAIGEEAWQAQQAAKEQAE